MKIFTPQSVFAMVPGSNYLLSISNYYCIYNDNYININNINFNKQ